MAMDPRPMCDRMLDHLADPGAVRIALVAGGMLAIGSAGQSPGTMPSLFLCAWLAYALSFSKTETLPGFPTGAEGARLRSLKLAGSGAAAFAAWLALACADAVLGGALSDPASEALALGIGPVFEAFGAGAPEAPKALAYALNATVSVWAVWVGFRRTRASADAAAAAG